MSKFISVKNVAKRYEIGRSTVWHWVTIGKLPKPHKLGSNTSRWKIEELDEADKQKNLN
jgi:predicted DNA-binding transcriptional regulator AlpA